MDNKNGTFVAEHSGCDEVAMEQVGGDRVDGDEEGEVGARVHDAIEAAG